MDSQSSIRITDSQSPVQITDSQSSIRITDSQSPIQIMDSQTPTRIIDSQPPTRITDDQSAPQGVSINGRWKAVFKFKEQFGVIICVQCEFAVVPTQVMGHLKKHHPSIPIGRRQEISKEISTLPGLAMQPEEVKYPTRMGPAIGGLSISKDGVECRWTTIEGEECGYICQSVDSMQKHCKKNHGWRNGKGRGGSKQHRLAEPINRIWEEKVWFQGFFKVGTWMRSFRIKAEDESQGLSAEEREKRELGVKLAAEYKQKMKEKKSGRVVQGVQNRYEATPWLEMTGWVKHLEGFGKEQLMGTIKPTTKEMTKEEKESNMAKERQKERRAGRSRIMVEEEEEMHQEEKECMGRFDEEEAEERDEGLYEASVATTRLIREALSICNTESVGNSTLEYVDRPEFGGGPGWRPFWANQKVKTIKKYTEVWVKVLRYIWRTADMDGAKRPGYELTEDQEMRLQALQETARARRGRGWKEAVQDEAGEFWMAMMNQELHSDHHESGLLSAMAVLALDTEDKGWAKPENYTPKIAAIVTSAKALVVWKAKKGMEWEIESIRRRQGCGEREAKLETKGMYERVQGMMLGKMTAVEVDGKPNVMDRLVRMLKYGREVRNRTKGEARASWEGETLIIDHQTKFSMDQLRVVVKGLLESAKKRMREELMLLRKEDDDEGDEDEGETKMESMPKFDMGSIKDNPGERSEGVNFIDFNDWEVDGYAWMSGRLNDHFGRMEGDRYRLKDGVVNAWMRELKRFKEELFVLVHLTGGAPARGTEVTSIKSENGVDGRVGRGIFVDRGLVSFVTTYNKTSGMSKKMRTIHRYVPKEVGELVIYYLWLIEPFVRQLQVYRKDEYDFSGYLWEPKPEEDWIDDEDEDEYEDEEEEEEAEEGEDERDEAEDGEEAEDDDDIGQISIEQGGAKMGKKKEEGLNMDGYWHTDRVRRVIGREFWNRITVKLTTALWRQAYPAIQRKFSKDTKVRELVEGLYEEGGVLVDAMSRVKIGKRGFNAREEQAGHSRWMEEMIYGLLYTESPESTLTEREEYRRVSLDWHRFLHFQSGWEDIVEQEEMMKKEEAKMEAERFVRWKRMREMNLEEGLKKLRGPEAVFRGLQRRALQAIISGERRILVVMGTGSGKSLLFMLPAKEAKDGLTVVIVPLNSLRDDMKGRCEEAGITAVEWSGKKPGYDARVVLVTPESAVTKAFGRFMEDRKAAGKLDRIVVDECHTILDASRKWRPKMLEMMSLMDKGVQVVFLTATLRPKDEVEFFGLMGVEEGEVLMLREATTRKNMEYQVVEYDEKQETEEVKRLVMRKLEEHEEGKVIIYCDSIDRAGSIADTVDGEIYNAQMGSEGMKKKVLKRLKEGDERVWVATNALGMGIDIANIRVVIHVRVKAKMRDYVQESGRGGRDGERSEGIIMRAVEMRFGKKVGIGEWWMEEEMKEYMLGNECRRKVMDREMDGRWDRLGCEIGEVRCDICRGVARGPKRRRIIVHNRVMDERGDEEMVRVRVGEVGERVRVEEMGERVRVEEMGERVRVEEVGERVRVEEVGERVRVEESVESEDEWGEIEEDVAGELLDSGLGMDWSDRVDMGEMMDIGGDGQDSYEVSRDGDEGFVGWKKQQEGYEKEERRRVLAKVAEGELLEELEEKLRSWKGRCVVCKAVGGRREKRCSASGWKECEMVEERERVSMELGLAGCKKIMIEGFAGCWGCWVPREICKRHVEEGTNNGGWKRFRKVDGKCQWGNLMKEVMVGLLMFRESELLKRKMERSRMDVVLMKETRRKYGIGVGSDEERIAKEMIWMGKKVNLNGVEMNDGCGMFLLIG